MKAPMKRRRARSRVDLKINTVRFEVGRHRLTLPQEGALRWLLENGGDVTFAQWLNQTRRIYSATFDALWSRGLCQPRNLGTKKPSKWAITSKGRLALEAL
jgi:hypothetical protein